MSERNDSTTGIALDAIEQELIAMSTPTESDDGLWRAAAAKQDFGRKQTSFSLESRVPNSVLAVAAVLVLSTLGVILMAPALGRARSSAVGSAPTDAAAGAGTEGLSLDSAVANRDTVALGQQWSESAEAPVSPRAVIRRATVAMRVEDVETAYAFASAMVEQALGEYVEKASISGAGPERRGELTLRVRAAKLDETLARLRDLGTVTSLTVSGEDVTDQAVDLDARLRNETRIEAELLELLESREDASLDDVFSVRRRLDDVRSEIERLTAQRDALGRRVALATITATFRPLAEPSAPVVEVEEATWWKRTRAMFAREFSRGGEEFVRSLAWLVRVGLGGAILWIPLRARGRWGWVAWRRARARAGYEPAPRLD
ncbi:MAG: DUF4349 domain-containing protein [Planctomycetota bacterium]